jgi:hypothetical protein
MFLATAMFGVVILVVVADRLWCVAGGFHRLTRAVDEEVMLLASFRSKSARSTAKFRFGVVLW